MAADAPQEGAFISKACFNNQLQFKTIRLPSWSKKRSAWDVTK